MRVPRLSGEEVTSVPRGFYVAPSNAPESQAFEPLTVRIMPTGGAKPPSDERPAADSQGEQGSDENENPPRGCGCQNDYDRDHDCRRHASVDITELAHRAEFRAVMREGDDPVPTLANGLIWPP